MKSVSMLAAMLGLGASLAPEMPPLAANYQPTAPRSNRRPAGAHKAFVRAAAKSRRVRAHRARA